MSNVAGYSHVPVSVEAFSLSRAGSNDGPSEIERFEIHVSDLVLEDLGDRLAATRFPDEIEDTGWEYGMPMGYLRELVEYWRNEYDWRAQEARLNELRHFRTRIDGHSDPLHPRPFAAPEGHAAAPRPRLAGLRRGVPRRDPAVDRAREARRRRRPTRST